MNIPVFKYFTTFMLMHTVIMHTFATVAHINVQVSKVLSIKYTSKYKEVNQHRKKKTLKNYLHIFFVFFLFW